VLTQFESAGLVLKHNFEGGHAVYELDRGEHHDHMVDVDTGKVVEFHSDEIEELQRRSPRRARLRDRGPRAGAVRAQEALRAVRRSRTRERHQSRSCPDGASSRLTSLPRPGSSRTRPAARLAAARASSLTLGTAQHPRDFVDATFGIEHRRPTIWVIPSAGALLTR
jgi:hypothetical protein